MSRDKWKEYCRELEALDIVQIVQEVTSFSLAELRGRRRMAYFVDARQLFVRLCEDHTTLSYCKMGHVMNRDHSTMIHVSQRIPSPQFTSWLQKAERLVDELKEREFGPEEPQDHRSKNSQIFKKIHVV
tara:strand:+ start:233 stop:619 length:387 start_codon:yes stop_codon:yes gene_type:complete